MTSAERALLVRFTYRLALKMPPQDLARVVVDAKRNKIPMTPLSPPILDWAKLLSERIIPLSAEEQS